MASERVRLIGIPPEGYPITFELLNADTDDVLRSEVLSGPGDISIRGIAGQGFPVRARMTLATGQVIEHPPRA